MEINKIGDNKYQVIHNFHIDIMTLDEVMILLTTPEEKPQDDFQMQLEEFWASTPVYPRM